MPSIYSFDLHMQYLSEFVGKTSTAEDFGGRFGFSAGHARTLIRTWVECGWLKQVPSRSRGPGRLGARPAEFTLEKRPTSRDEVLDALRARRARPHPRKRGYMEGLQAFFATPHSAREYSEHGRVSISQGASQVRQAFLDGRIYVVGQRGSTGQVVADANGNGYAKKGSPATYYCTDPHAVVPPGAEGPTRFDEVAQYFSEPRAVGDYAAAYNMTRPAAALWVRRAMDRGLVKPAGKRQWGLAGRPGRRPGRPEQLYCSDQVATVRSVIRWAQQEGWIPETDS